MQVCNALTYMSLLYGRLYLAAMHYNENGDCAQATTNSGQPIVFPKSKKSECSAKPLKTAPSYGMLYFILYTYKFTLHIVMHLICF